MGKLEQENKESVRKTRIQEAILLTIASSGRVGGNLLIKGVLDSLFGTDFSTTAPRRNEIVKTSASRMTEKGLLKFENGHYSMTKVGEKILQHWRQANFIIKRPRKWDKKWRIIIFDIPENKKRVRNKLREILRVAGFQRLQDSVWVYPYDCEDVIGLLKTDLGISGNLLYIIADRVENDKYLRMDFDLVS